MPSVNRSRRMLLQGLGQVATASLFVPAGRQAWAAVGRDADGSQPRLVVVFLRGAVDGLSVVVPYGDPAYAATRPSLALARPGADGGVLDLDGRFGLHPALSPLLPLWKSGVVGFVHACGSHDPSRSHFDAQDFMESATPGRKSTPDGWMNRLLAALPAPAQAGPAAMRAVSIGPVLPRILSGRHPVSNVASGQAATRPTLLDRPAIGQAFDALYAGNDRMARAYRESQETGRDMRQAMKAEPADPDAEMQAASNGAAPAGGFPDDAARLARLMRNEARVQLGFMAVGGWDTHANQGAATGQLANRLAPLGRGLVALADGLGGLMDNTVVVVMSEFGRTVRENGNRGTDHGHGNLMWLLGGPVAGGRIHGRWPGLDQSALYEGRDLAVTTDFRDVLAAVLGRHLRLRDGQLTQVLPGFTPTAGSTALLKV